MELSKSLQDRIKRNQGVHTGYVWASGIADQSGSPSHIQHLILQDYDDLEWLRANAPACLVATRVVNAEDEFPHDIIDLYGSRMNQQGEIISEPDEMWEVNESANVGLLVMLQFSHLYSLVASRKLISDMLDEYFAFQFAEEDVVHQHLPKMQELIQREQAVMASDGREGSLDPRSPAGKLLHGVGMV